jgi:hypothetical protein
MSCLLRPKFAALHNRETASSLNEKTVCSNCVKYCSF